MTDTVRDLTAELAGDPGSLAFLELGELLRRRGQPEAGLRIAEAGTRRYPLLADGWDLCGRLHSDLGAGDAAFDAWMRALQIDPGHAGAHKGLGFLFFRAGDLRRAVRHLEAAAAQSDDPGLKIALARVAAVAGPAAPAPARAPLPFTMDDEPGYPPPAEPVDDRALFAGFEGAGEGLLLLDQNGLRLGGALTDAAGRDVADAVAAHLAGVSREAARAARLLDLGEWSSLAAESGAGNVHLSMPTGETVLLTARDASVPAGRLALLAERAGAAARRWLGTIR